MSNEGEMILRHAWQLWFGPELEKQGRPGDWPPPDDIHAAQAIWEREGGLVVLFNQNLRPLHVKVRKGVISKGQERPMEEILHDILEVSLEGGLAHFTALRGKEVWPILWNFTWHTLLNRKVSTFVAERTLPSPARYSLPKILGEDYECLLPSALALVLGERGGLVGSDWALRKVLEEDAYGTGIHSRRAKTIIVELDEAVTEAVPQQLESRLMTELLEDLPGYDEAVKSIQQGYTQEEIAKEQGIDQATVSRRIRSFLEAARERLNRQDGFGRVSKQNA